MTDKFQGGRLGDYVFDCQICGQRAWFSESFTLSVYTGRGGLRVCSECKDPIDYGLVPYKVPAEQPVPLALDSNYTANPTAIPQIYAPFNYQLFDPMSTSPATNASEVLTWDKLNLLTWDQWLNPWGT